MQRPLIDEQDALDLHEGISVGHQQNCLDAIGGFLVLADSVKLLENLQLFRFKVKLSSLHSEPLSLSNSPGKCPDPDKIANSGNIPSVVNVFGVYLTVVYWNQVPEEMFDAAMMDGAGDLMIFFKIGLPIVIPGFTTLVLLSFVAIWNNYFLPLVMLSSSDKFPLILGITTITSLQGFPVYNLTIMGAFLTAIPLLVLFSVSQRFIAPQLTGAIK